MRANLYFISTTVPGTRIISLIAQRNVQFRVIGASMPISISMTQRSRYVQSVSLMMPEGIDQGLVAVHVRESFSGKHGNTVHVQYLLRVNMLDAPPHVDLSDSWIGSDADHIGQLVEESLEVHTQDRTFTSSADAAEKDCTLSFCNDADAMCRYLIDEISLEELEKKSKGDFFTILPPELQLYLLRLREQREFLRADGQRYIESFIKETEVMKLEAWKKAAVALDLYASIPWWKRRARQESLETARRLLRDAQQRSI